MLVHVNIFQTSSVNILVKQDGLNADHSLNNHILEQAHDLLIIQTVWINEPMTAESLALL